MIDVFIKLTNEGMACSVYGFGIACRVLLSLKSTVGRNRVMWDRVGNLDSSTIKILNWVMKVKNFDHLFNRKLTQTIKYLTRMWM